MEQILVPILDHIQSTVDQTGAVYFCRPTLVQQYQ